MARPGSSRRRRSNPVDPRGLRARRDGPVVGSPPSEEVASVSGIRIERQGALAVLRLDKARGNAIDEPFVAET